MLTSELLVTKTYKGKIKPVYAGPDYIKTADILIKTFKRNIGETYGNLMEEVQGFEEMDYRLIRGLTQILLRRCEIESDTELDPVELRQAVFKECPEIITSSEERDHILQNAAEKLSLSKGELEQNLWSDLDENKFIKSFQPISPDSLLKQYNISLIQTLLFRAVDMDLKIKGNFKQVLQAILRSGLMYSFNEIPEGNGKTETNNGMGTVNLHIDGPASLFKMSERYGRAFAKLVPFILDCYLWNIKANISHKTASGKRIFEFTVDDKDDIYGLKTSQNMVTETPEDSYGDNKDETEFDSSVEYEFAQFSFREWNLYREPVILKAGEYAFIPDFSLQKRNLTVYVEIVGFWTHEYLKKKIEKVSWVNVPIILIINNKLKCSEKDFKAENVDVLFYNRKIPYKEIMQILRRYEKEKLDKEHNKIKDVDVPLKENIININDLARKQRVWKEALKQTLEQKLDDNSEYTIFGDYLIHDIVINEIDSQIKNLKTYSDVVDVLKRYKLDKQVYYPVLDYLGYKVIWKGLGEDTAEIQKK